jgi:putative PEP-CTERM system TPR-repeat lipoprotein
VRFSTTATLLTLSLLLTACGGFDKSAQENLASAKQHYAKHELRASIIDLKNALQQQPENAEARLLLGEIYLLAGDGASAEKELKRAAASGVPEASLMPKLARAILQQGDHERLFEAIRPDERLPEAVRAELHVIRAMSLLNRGKVEEAGKELQEGYRLAPALPQVMIAQARLALTHGKLDEAGKWTDKARTVAPQLAEVWTLVGDYQFARKDLKAAKAAYAKAIEGNPFNSADHLKRAVLFIETDAFDEARAEIEAVKKLSPRHPGILYTRGLLHFRKKNYKDAESDLQEALKYDSKGVNVLYYLAMTHYLQGHEKQARQYFNQFLTVQPNAVEPRLALATLYLRARDYALLDQLLAPLLAMDPPHALALRMQGMALLARGNQKEGVALLEKALAQQPKDASVQAQLGASLLRQGEAGAGVAQLEQALALDPELRYADLMLVLTHLRSKDYPHALAAAGDFHQRQPKSALPLNLKGLILISQGKRDEARDAYNESLKLAPGDPTATEALASLAEADKQPDEARRLFEDALKQHPKHLGMLLSCAAFEQRQGHDKESVALLERAVREHPKALEPRLPLARRALATGQPLVAINQIDTLRATHGEHPQWLEIMGLAQIANNDAASAIVSFTKLTRAQPRSAQAQVLLARAYAEANKPVELRAALEQALKLEAKNDAARMAMVRLLALEDKLVEARATLEALRREYPDNPVLDAESGWLALREKNPEVAVVAYRKAFERAPNGDHAVRLALAQLQASEPQDAKKTLQGWLAKQPEHAAALENLANLHLALGEQDAARDAFARLVVLQPGNALALNNLAWLLRKQDPRAARRHAERALEMAPKSPIAQDTLGMILLDAGEPQQAERLLEQAIRTAPSAPAIRYHLAMAKAENGAKAEALKLLDEALAGKQRFAERAEAEALHKRLTRQ